MKTTLLILIAIAFIAFILCLGKVNYCNSTYAQFNPSWSPIDGCEIHWHGQIIPTSLIINK